MDSAHKKRALRSFTNGVYILTSRCGDRFGAATVSWVSQASFKPPLLMAAVRRESTAFKCLSQSRVAALHVIAAGQESLAQTFFLHTVAAPGQINGEPFAERTTSAPVLETPPAYVECEVRELMDTGGDHMIVILEVVEAHFRREFEPLTMRHSPWEYGG
jgi:flavin reductase (DIM6/NTAB) family NADH-FMN oxidoreductase RutF